MRYACKTPNGCTGHRQCQAPPRPPMELAFLPAVTGHVGDAEERAGNGKGQPAIRSGRVAEHLVIACLVDEPDLHAPWYRPRRPNGGHDVRGAQREQQKGFRG